MMALWLGAFLISMSWLYSVHLYLYPNHWATGALIAGGVAAFSLAVRKHADDLARVNRLWALLIVPLGFAIVVLGFPGNSGPLLLAAGLVLLLRKDWPVAACLSVGLLLSGLILTLQSVAYPLYVGYVAAEPHVPFLTGFVHPLLKYTGLRVSESGGIMYIHTMRNTWPFPTSWANLALFPLLQFGIAGGVVSMFFADAIIWIRGLWMFIVGIAYMLVRYAVMLLVFTYLMYYVGYFDEQVWITIFWNRAVTLLSFVPLLLIFAKAFPLFRSPFMVEKGLRFDTVAKFTKARKTVALAALSAGVFCFVGYVGYWDPGVRHDGRILLDEKHSEWEKSTNKYDTTWYGNESGYNYWSMADFLSYYYKIDKNIDKLLTADTLKDYDVLLLKNPTSPYSDEEVAAMVNFVQNGGGIFLMGEHTNVFGTSAPLNRLARRFGFSFRFDSVFDMEKKFEQLWHVPQLLPSPLVQNQESFLFATSCSIEPERYFGRTRNAVTGPGLWSLPIEYASGNFYPSVDLRTDMTYGPLVQMITARYGQGRVIGFSDSTTFSNFSALLPGKPQMLLSSMNWLNHGNRSGLRRGFLYAGLVLLLIAVAVPIGTKPHFGAWLAMASSGACVAAAAMLIFTGLTKDAYPLPEPVRPVPKVVFEKQYSEYEIPISGFVKDQQESFAIFYQWVLRLQYFPFLKDDFDDALAEKPQVLVMINPSNMTPPDRDYVTHADTRRIREKMIPQLRQYLENGGSLLLMDDAGNEKSMSKMILPEFGLRLESAVAYGQKPSMTMLTDLAGNQLVPVSAQLQVVGGKPLLKTSDGKVVLAKKQVGKGTLLVMSASKRFCDAKMGFSQSNVPNSDALKASYLEFAIIRGLMNGTVEEELENLKK